MSFSLRALVVAGICSLFGSYVAIAQSCDSGKGVCVNTTQETCDGILKTGYCPGPNEIMCCEPVAELPERCKSGGPALLESSYEFTLENQGTVCVLHAQYQILSTEALTLCVLFALSALECRYLFV